jgi:hypothetical protein
MKRNKLTLGLLVFFLGIVLSACGSNKSSSPAANPNGNGNGNGNGTITTPSTNCPNNQTSCQLNRSGNYRVMNADLYRQNFGYNNQGGGTIELDSGFQLDGFGCHRVSGSNSCVWFADLSWGNLECRISAADFNSLSRADIDLMCMMQNNTTIVDYTNAQFPAHYTYNIVNNSVQSIGITINNSISSQVDSLNCSNPNGNTMTCRDQRTGSQMGLRSNGGGNFSLVSPQGVEFGQFQMTGI